MFTWLSKLINPQSQFFFQIIDLPLPIDADVLQLGVNNERQGNSGVNWHQFYTGKEGWWFGPNKLEFEFSSDQPAYMGVWGEYQGENGRISPAKGRIRIPEAPRKAKRAKGIRQSKPGTYFVGMFLEQPGRYMIRIVE